MGLCSLRFVGFREVLAGCALGSGIKWNAWPGVVELKLKMGGGMSLPHPNATFCLGFSSEKGLVDSSLAGVSACVCRASVSGSFGSLANAPAAEESDWLFSGRSWEG